MAIRAENDPRYWRRFLIMGILALGFSLWCLKDAIISYPAEQASAFEEFKVFNKAKFDTPAKKAFSPAEFEAQADKEGRDAWIQYVRAGEVHTKADIVTQYVMAVITAVVGLWLISLPIRARSRWIEWDDSELRTSWGQSFQAGQVESINKRKWRDKGLATITYHDGNRQRRFILDDMKFKRDATDAILFELEQKIGVEKIMGGPSEPSLDESPEHDEYPAAPAAQMSDHPEAAS
jgi:hypothetical protein